MISPSTLFLYSRLAKTMASSLTLIPYDKLETIVNYFPFPQNLILKELIKLLKKIGIIPNIDTVKLVILGSKGSGKSELWDRLKGEKPNSQNYSIRDIESFKLKGEGGKEIIILKATDLGGDNELVKEYEHYLKDDGTFVFFIVNLEDIKEKREEIRSRLQLIFNELSKHEKCGIRILASHYDSYTQSGKGRSEMDATKYVRETIFDKPINLKDDSFNKLHFIEGFIHPVNLTNEQDVNKIRELIANRKNVKPNE